MNEHRPGGLDKATLDRIVREWDKRSGQGPFSLDTFVWFKPNGTQGDAIHIIEEGEQDKMIIDKDMSADLD